MNAFVIYELATGEIRRILSGGYIAPSEIPQGCWFVAGRADPKSNYVDVSDSDPSKHFIAEKKVEETLNRKDVNSVRNALEVRPIECVSLGTPLTIDADPLSLQRMADEIEYWDELVGDYSKKRRWTIADNSEIFIDRYQLELLYNEARKKVALRRKRLFDRAKQLVGSLATVTPKDLEEDLWPL